mmetsp:Transcript_3306/g.8560  ORF Transcript_3306/g.8560 Transcript_3306/m.8560 type:complete len:220 (+) Transcript_3306:837-1496(+)
MTAALIDASNTTHAPPRISAYGGMNTNTGCSYATKASTMREPYLSTSSNISRCPPENPLQLAKTMRGRSSVRKSLMACAVLYALLGNHTHPACCTTDSDAPTSAGSAGLIASAVRFSVATTPMGIPPKRARPTTTVLAHPARASVNDPRSKNPLLHSPLSVSSHPSNKCRGSYGSPGDGANVIGRSTSSIPVMSVMGRSPPRLEGTYESQSTAEATAPR